MLHLASWSASSVWEQPVPWIMQEGFDNPVWLGVDGTLKGETKT